MNNIKLYNGDCLKVMQEMADKEKFSILKLILLDF